MAIVRDCLPLRFRALANWIMIMDDIVNLLNTKHDSIL